MILTLDDAQEYIAKLEAENAELKQFAEDLGKYAAGQNLLYETSLQNQLKLMTENAALRQQVENLRCCGNCFNFYQGLCCPTTNEPVNHYCEQYESDNMTREDRNDG